MTDAQINEWWISACHQISCRLCARLGEEQSTRTIAHHDTDRAKGKKSDDCAAMAICEGACHVGPEGVHGSRERLRRAKCSQLDLRADTFRELVKQGFIRLEGL